MVISVTHRRRSHCPRDRTDHGGNCPQDMLNDMMCVDLFRMTALYCKFKPKE